MPSLYDFAGGEEALHRLEDMFYNSVLKDSLLQPLFGAGQPQHVDHLTAFTASRSIHSGAWVRPSDQCPPAPGITEEQRQRFVELYMAAMDAVDLPDD